MTKRILLVDDERSIRESLNKILRVENYDVVLAENGLEAIEKQAVEHIDLLILDLNMPLKDGWDALGALIEINPRLPVVIITGRSNQRILAESTGADAVMEKPLDVPLLLQTIRALLDEPMENRALRASNRAARFRYVACDNKLFREMLSERYSTPYRFLESKDIL